MMLHDEEYSKFYAEIAKALDHLREAKAIAHEIRDISRAADLDIKIREIDAL